MSDELRSRLALVVIGAIFLFFGVRQFYWHETVEMVGILCVLASLPFFGFALLGSNEVIRQLFKWLGSNE
ncbi:MAG: hypothetical protein KJZ96_03595 [Rhodocyclaceae bacterium]|jgi:energy-converting hydrogenase Eha subunit H|nr:hypothetical protein [Rhodocyclaceae bacterium]